MEQAYEIVPVTSAASRREFIDFPKRLYRGDRHWVPAFDMDMNLLLRKRHPFFRHSEGEFVLVRRGGETAARGLVVDNPLYNNFHGTSFAFFDNFDAVDEQGAAAALFDHFARWARSRGLKALCGPMLSGGTYGAGILVHGFEHPPAMTMMRYNRPYYARLLEGCGFTKYLDLNSLSIPPERMELPERVRRLAERVRDRGRLKLLDLRSKADIRRVAGEIKGLYGGTLTHHLEDYPLTPEELDQVEKDLLTIADPELVTLLEADGAVVGYAFGFADLSPVLRRNRGKLSPMGILRLLRGMRSTRKILFNGIGILPKYQSLGGNALMYLRMAEVIRKRGFTEIEMVQISEETELMLSDARTLGGAPYKIHRMYRKGIGPA